MKAKTISFKLTEPQYQILCPLLRKVDKAWASDHPGAILLQAKGYEVTGGFVPEPYAKKISEMLEKLQEPDFDDSIYHISCTEREAHPKELKRRPR